jgi:hypothetical protein
MSPFNRPSTIAAAFVLLNSAVIAAPLAAQYRGLSLGLGVEANTVSLQSLSYGGLFMVENRLNRSFALTFQGNVSVQNGETQYGTAEEGIFLGVEAAGFVRFYFLSPPEMRQSGVELFVGAGGGVIATLNGQDPRNSRGSPEAGCVFGTRFRLGAHFYIEPYIRSGYPFIGGAGVMAGLRFTARADPIQVIEDEFTIAFRPNIVNFDNLDYFTAIRNDDTLSEILATLEKKPSARALIEGYTKRVATANRKGSITFVSLREKRAAYIAERLISNGVSQKRLVKDKNGGKRPTAESANEEGEQTRYVTIRLLR